MVANAKYLRDGLGAMTHEGLPRFIFLDNGDAQCLPVVTPMLNPAHKFSYDDIDLQHVLSQHHGYVSGYKRGLDHPITEEKTSLFNDESAEKTLFRIVVKRTLIRDMADHLLGSLGEAFAFLDAVDFSGVTGLQPSSSGTLIDAV